jgi:hypothetical protein
MIVVEAREIELDTSTLAANGAGGGGSQRGVSGLLGMGIAVGGTPNATIALGGNGSSTTTNATIGANGNTGGGGGGGGAGRLVLNTGDGLLTSGASILSPATTIGTVPIE